MRDRFVTIDELDPGSHFYMAGDLYVKTHPYSDEWNAVSCETGVISLIDRLLIIERVKVRVER